MAVILNIDTSTNACSVALSKDGEVVIYRLKEEGRNHSELLGVFVDEVLNEAEGLGLSLDAVAFSAGPGSYTGLRIGVSLAKGLCFGYQIPLISIETLKVMSLSASRKWEEDGILCPMIDARRMEVYDALFDADLTNLRETKAEIIDENSFASYLTDQKVCFFGDGSDKCKELLSSENAVFLEGIMPLAMDMASLAEEAYQKAQFVDVAYYEPHYLKEFMVTTSKKDLLGLGKK